MKKTISIFSGIYIALLLVFVATGFFLQAQENTSVIQGSITASERRISAKIPGRVAEVKVKEGQQVSAGDVIFRLESPELDAKMDQARAALAAKTALKNRADKGARFEEINMAEDAWLRAKIAAELSSKTRERIENLYNEGLVPLQKLDEALAQQKSSNYLAQSAFQRLQMGRSGTEDELKSAAGSEQTIAEAMLAEVAAAYAETVITSSHKGRVTEVLIHEGEISPAGFPVVTLVDMTDAWVRFHVQETEINQYKEGSIISVFIPALSKRVILEVSYISIVGEYGNWKASKMGEFDIKTFEVRARPLNYDVDWRLGMTVIIEQDHS